MNIKELNSVMKGTGFISIRGFAKSYSIIRKINLTNLLQRIQEHEYFYDLSIFNSILHRCNCYGTPPPSNEFIFSEWDSQYVESIEKLKLIIKEAEEVNAYCSYFKIIT